MPVILRGNQLELHSPDLLPIGYHALPDSPTSLYVQASNIWIFSEDTDLARGIRADRVPIASLTPPTPNPPIHPEGLTYTPHDAFVTKDGVLYLLSRSDQSLFRWDLQTQAYVSTMPLLGEPTDVTYSPVNHTIYLAYPNGLIRQINLHQEEPEEVPFATLALAPQGLAAADAYVFAVDMSGAWDTHYTFSPTGERISMVDWARRSIHRSYAWSSTRQRMYHLRDTTSPRDLMWREINADGQTYSHLAPGALGASQDSPLHSTPGFVPPVRVAPDGSVVVLGSGVIHDAETLSRLSVALTDPITDAAWVNDQLRTIRTVNGQTVLQHWVEPDFTLENTLQLPGTANRLLSVEPDQLLAITIVAGQPTFYLLNADSDVIKPPEPFVIENRRGGGTAALGWNGTFWVTQGQTFTLDEPHTLQRASFNIQENMVARDRFRATLWDWHSTNAIVEVASMTDATEIPGWKQFDFPNIFLPPGEYAITVSVEPTGLKAWAGYGFAVPPGDVLPGKRITFADPSAGWAKHPFDSQCRFEFMPLETASLTIDATPQNVGTPSPLPYGNHTFHPGTAVTSCVPDVVTTDDPGVRYALSGWTGTGSVPAAGTNTCVSFTLEVDSGLIWHWQRQYELHLIAEQGALHGATDGFYNESAQIQLIPEASFGHAFSHWLVNGNYAGTNETFEIVLDEPKTIEAVFVRIFLDVTEEVTLSFHDWYLNPQSGTFFATIEMQLLPNAEKILIEPFWLVFKETPEWQLMHPDGVETNSGHPYVDVTDAVLAQLPFVGNGDLVLDPGESVRIENIEFYSMYRRVPTGMVYAVWADPPPDGVFEQETAKRPYILNLQADPHERTVLSLEWESEAAGTYHLETFNASEGTWELRLKDTVEEPGTYYFLVEHDDSPEMKLFRIRKQKGRP